MSPSLVHRISLCTVATLAAAQLAACSHDDKQPMTPMTTASSVDSGTMHAAHAPADAGKPTMPPEALTAGTYCALPGSYVSTDQGMTLVTGGDPDLPDLSWVKVPKGYCVHHFAHVAETRQLRVSPNGDVFAASPSMPTAGLENEFGKAAIFVLPDDDRDGLADANMTFIDKLPQTQGLTFANGHLYFQDGPALKRVPYKPGDRTPSGEVETVTSMRDSDAQQFPYHWPKVVDVAKDGTIYFTNGSVQEEICYSPGERTKHAPTGVVFKVLPDGSLRVVAQGFRNPIALRCESMFNVCLLVELARDGSGSQGGREKIVPIRQGDDWGFPCCATRMQPYAEQVFQDPDGEPMTGQPLQAADCSGVAAEEVSLKIGDTPFGIDFEGGAWEAPWQNRAFVAMHGAVGTYIGSRVVALGLDMMSGMPLPSSDIEGLLEAAPNMMDFVTGWDDRTQSHGRATAVAFGGDGRLYIGDDTKGEIFWVAPVDLKRDAR